MSLKDFSVQVFPTEGRVYMGGRTWENWLESAGNLIQVSEGAEAVITPTFAGTHVIHRYYRGASAPLQASTKTFTTGFLADDEADYFTFKRLEGAAEPVIFFPGLWVPEIFRVETGKTYKLRRAVALDVVPGLEAEDWPTEIRLDDVVDPGAATITGRNITANASGTLAITYAPAFEVMISGVQEDIQDADSLVVSMTLLDVVRGVGV